MKHFGKPGTGSPPPFRLWDAAKGELIVEIMQRNAEISEHHMVVTFCTRLLQIKRDASYRADAEIRAAFNFDHMGNAMAEQAILTMGGIAILNMGVKSPIIHGEAFLSSGVGMI